MYILSVNRHFCIPRPTTGSGYVPLGVHIGIVGTAGAADTAAGTIAIAITATIGNEGISKTNGKEFLFTYSSRTQLDSMFILPCLMLSSVETPTIQIAPVSTQQRNCSSCTCLPGVSGAGARTQARAVTSYFYSTIPFLQHLVSTSNTTHYQPSLPLWCS